ncbi:ABC transporter permease [Alteromonas sp. 14N.309.X.WAT.G.H12]|uniref:ABC transporter permease n=1 Tax=Alteromonas sp. 14N.309.X.WAT.G.H12 TaxID=3120824 RepID=UPI002FD6D90C
MANIKQYFQFIFNLCQKEFLTVLKDPSSRIILILPIIMQSILFGYAATFDLKEVPYAVLDQSNSQASHDVLQKLKGAGLFNQVATLHGSDEVADVIGNQEALMVVYFPADFADKLGQGEASPLQLIVDGRNSATANAVVGSFSTITLAYNASTDISSQLPITVKSRAWFNPNMETRWIIMPGMIAALSMIQTMMLTALSVAREREQGTFDQLLVTPSLPSQILISKAVPSILIGLVQSTLVLLICRFWFDIPFQGSLLVLYLGLFLFTLASVGVGLSISAVSLNMQQAMLYTFVLLMPLMLLSGYATPLANMPDLMQDITYVNPLRFSISIVRRVYLEGATLADVYTEMLPLILIAAVTLPVASWLFRHRTS